MMNSSPFTGHQFGLAAPSVPGPANFGFNGILVQWARLFMRFVLSICLGLLKIDACSKEPDGYSRNTRGSYC